MIPTNDNTWRDDYRRLASRLNTPAGVSAAVEHIWADVRANPTPAASEPFHGDLIPDVDYLSGVECDMRAEREAAV